MTDEERAAIVESDSFRNFFERSAKVVERALNDPFDFFVDYASDTVVECVIPSRHTLFSLTHLKGTMKARSSCATLLSTRSCAAAAR